MTRAEMELHSIRTTIHVYENALKDKNISEEKKKELKEKINVLGSIRDSILKETSNYGLNGFDFDD